MANITGWERENRIHFNEIVVNYDKIRPEYPKELFVDVIKYSKPKNGKKALEIGAGTGKATTPFLAAGYNITAIDISENMAAFLLQKFKGHENLNVIVASFEDALLEENSYNLVYAASAFHWVDAEIGCSKAFRLLINGGAIALLRYNEIASIEDKLYDEIRSIYIKHYHSYYGMPNRPPIRKTHKDFEAPDEILKGFGFKNLQAYGFRDVTMKFYDTTLTFNADEYIEFIDTMSSNRCLPESNRKALYTEIKEAILKHGDYYELDYVFQIYMGRK